MLAGSPSADRTRRHWAATLFGSRGVQFSDGNTKSS
ncbi:Uncharacterised protein [Mycobacteroides abscessus subsp. abscessus]|nr:Uncharacterised protein [Mycobacteroides abscessus subsp. abscessus]